MKITICLGGSVINPDDEIKTEILKKTAEAITEMKEQNHEILVVTGGGHTSRKYIEAAKELGAENKIMDEIGISATKLNAKILIAAMGEIASPELPETFEKAINILLRDKVPVMGGTQPGHTTDAVAAEIADSSNSELLIFLTDVDGIYTEDPNENEDAEKMFNMAPAELSELMSQMEFKPGMTAIIDPFAAEIIQNSKIRTLVLSGEEIEKLPKIVEGSPHNGTEISPEE